MYCIYAHTCSVCVSLITYTVMLGFFLLIVKLCPYLRPSAPVVRNVISTDGPDSATYYSRLNTFHVLCAHTQCMCQYIRSEHVHSYDCDFFVDRETFPYLRPSTPVVRSVIQLHRYGPYGWQATL